MPDQPPNHSPGVPGTTETAMPDATDAPDHTNESPARKAPLVAPIELKPRSERQLSRRFLLRNSGVAVAAGVGAVAGHQIAPAQDQDAATPVAKPDDPVPPPPETQPTITFLRPDEARTVEAIAARIIPGTPDDPGAREAGVIYYIDHLLANGDGFAEPTYRQPPFPMTYDGDEPPDDDNGNGLAVIWVAADELERYGFQSRLTPRQMYRDGLAALNRYATDRFGGAFADLNETEQDQILISLEDDEAEGFEAPSATEFFEMLRDHTMQGMFADPAYGGNRDLVGWIMLGYPGSQRGYSPREMKQEGTDRQPQSLNRLAHFHPGRPEGNPVLPVRGSEEALDHDAPGG